MSKRYSNVVHEKFVQKRARLDVKIDTNVRINTNLFSSNSAGPSRAPSSLPFSNQLSNTKDLWGEDDEDDEFILLASQVADALEKNQNQPNSQPKETENTELTFGRFSRDVKSSTQKPSGFLDSCFDDGDDLLKDFIDRENKDEKEDKLKRDDPKDVRKSTQAHSNEIQVNYLRNQLVQLRKENERLKEENSVTFEKYQIKDGEAKTLRYELEQQQFRAPSILNANAEAESARQMLQVKVKEQEKMIRALEAENTMRNAVERSFYTQHLQAPKDEDYDLNLSSVDLLRLLFENDLKLDVFRFKTEVKGTDMDKRLLKFAIEIQNIMSKPLSFEDSEEIEAAYRVIQSLTLKGIIQIRKYSLNLEFVSYTDSKYIPSIEYLNLSDGYQVEKYLNKDLDLFQLDKIYPDEASVVGRRFLAIVAFVCEKFPIINYLLEEISVPDDDDVANSDRESFLNLLLKTIHDIGYSNNYLRYIVFVHAASVLLNSLATQLLDTAKHVSFASEFFKNVVLARPHMNTLIVLSRFLMNICEAPIAPKFLSLLCHSSPRNNFAMNEAYKIQQFLDESCTLQIYCALLESTCLEVYQSKKPNQWWIDALMELTLNTVTFFLGCFGRHTQWMRDLPESVCDCYNKVGSCVVMMIHSILDHWLKDGMKQCKKTSKIAREGVLLLHMIFSYNFKEGVLRVGGHQVKNRLQKIYNLTRNYYRFFDFEQSHKCATESFNLKLILVDPLGSQSDSSPDDPTDNYLTEMIKNFF